MTFDFEKFFSKEAMEQTRMHTERARREVAKRKRYTVELTASELKALEKLRKNNQELTVDELFQKTLKEYWSAKRYESSGWKREVKLLYNKNIGPVFGKIRLSQVEPYEVKQWHKGFADRPTTGNRSLAVFSRMFAFAIEEELIPQKSNPCALVSKFTEKKRKRYATEDEIKKIAEILKREAPAHPKEVVFLYLLMFSGSRPRAIERATRDQMEVVEMNGKKFGLLTFQGKTSETTGEDEAIVIPPQAMELLDLLPSHLPTLTGTKMPRAFWERVRNEAGCPDLWARDWRRTFATLALSEGLAEGVLGELLNHRSAQTTKIYGKLTPNKRIDAVSKIGEKLEDLIGA